MREYKTGVIFTLIVVYFLLSSYEMIINKCINVELNKQIEYVATAIEECFLEKMASINGVQDKFYSNSLHGSKDILPELSSVPYKNNERRLSFTTQEATGVLRGYTGTLDLVTSAYMVLENGEMYVYSKINDYNTQYKIENDRFEKEDKTYIKILDKGISNERVLLFARPMHNIDNIHIGTLYFEVPYERLYNYFSCLNFYVYNYYFTISDINNNVIYSNENKFIYDSGEPKFYANVENVKNTSDNVTIVDIDDYLLKISVSANEKEVFSDLFEINSSLITICIFVTLFVCVILLFHSPKINLACIVVIIFAGVLLYSDLSTSTKNSIDNARAELVETFGRLYELHLSEDYEDDKKRIKGLASSIINNETNVVPNISPNTVVTLNKFVEYKDIETLILANQNSYVVYPTYQKDYVDEEKVRAIYNYEYSSVDEKIHTWSGDNYLLTYKIQERDELIIMIIARNSLSKYLNMLDANIINDIKYAEDDLNFDILDALIQTDVKDYERNRIEQDTRLNGNQSRIVSSRIINEIDINTNTSQNIESKDAISQYNANIERFLEIKQDIEAMVDKIENRSNTNIEELTNGNKLVVKKVQLDKLSKIGIFNKAYTYIMIIGADYDYNVLEGTVILFNNENINFVTTIFNTILIFIFIILIVVFILIYKNNKKGKYKGKDLCDDDDTLQALERTLENDDENID